MDRGSKSKQISESGKRSLFTILLYYVVLNGVISDSLERLENVLSLIVFVRKETRCGKENLHHISLRVPRLKIAENSSRLSPAKVIPIF